MLPQGAGRGGRGYFSRPAPYGPTKTHTDTADYDYESLNLYCDGQRKRNVTALLLPMGVVRADRRDNTQIKIDRHLEMKSCTTILTSVV